MKKKLIAQPAPIIWLFGLPCAGKTTIGNLLTKKITNLNILVKLIDGDILRNGICNDLGFSSCDRHENIRRVMHIAKILSDIGILTIVSCITPFEYDREKIYNVLSKNKLFLIFIDTPLNVCIDRDAKGLYKKAINGEIENFTGISSPFDHPKKVDFIIRDMTPELAVKTIITKIGFHLPC